MLALLIASILAQASKDVPQAGTETAYDSIRDLVKSTLCVGRVSGVQDDVYPKIDMYASFEWSGRDRAALKPSDMVVIRIESTSKGWQFDEKCDLAMSAGTQRIRVQTAERTAKVKSQPTSHTAYKSLDGSYQFGTVYPTVVTGTILFRCESVVWKIPFGKLKRWASTDATFAEIAAGDRTWRLDDSQFASLRGWITGLSMSGPDAEKAEAEAMKARLAVKAAQRARLDPYRAEVAAILSKADKAVHNLPRKLQAVNGERTRRRMITEGMTDLAKKHNLTQKDVDELLFDHPGLMPSR